MVARVLTALAVITACVTSSADAQFRRGMLAESTEILLYPHQAPALLLPAGRVEVELRNATGAPARVVERLHDLLARQLSENDRRLEVVEKGGGVVVTATVVEWNESRHSSTKYVSEQRQVGTKQVKDKNGNWKSEPVYEYGRNKPSVVISAAAGLRLEVRRRSGGTPVADETARHEIREEVLVEAGPPSRDAVEDMLLDNVVRKGAGRISPGRASIRVLLARSDDVDRLNQLAQERKWQDWLSGLEAGSRTGTRSVTPTGCTTSPWRTRRWLYESTDAEDWRVRLGLASNLIAGAATQERQREVTLPKPRTASPPASPPIAD